MTTSITLKSPGALALAVFFALVTARTIFDDVWHGAEVTTAHLQSLAAIVAALASGHFIWPQMRQAHIGAVIGLILTFTAGTAYVVVSAGTRNADTLQAKVAKVETLNAQRQAQTKKLSEAEADLIEAGAAAKAAADAADKECSSGKGTRCDGRSNTRDYAARDLEKAQSHAALMRAKLDMLAPEADPHGGYAYFAEVLAATPWVTATAISIEARLVLLMPFIVVLISEIATLTFSGMAIGHGAASKADKEADKKPGITVPSDAELSELRRRFLASDGLAPDVPAKTSATVLAFSKPDPKPVNDPDGSPDNSPDGPPKPGKRAPDHKPGRKAEIVSDIAARHARGERFDSQEGLRALLAGRFGALSKSTLSDWLGELELSGAIVREQDGRRKRVG